MLPEDALRQLTADRRRDREREARAERLATRSRALRARPDEGRARIPLLGGLVTTRRHALP